MTYDESEKKTLRKELESEQRLLKALSLQEGIRAVLEIKEFRDSARAIFDACKRLIGATAGYVALLHEDGKGNELLFLESGDLICSVDRSLPMPIRGLREEAYRTCRAVYDNDFSNNAWARYLPEGHATLDNVIFAPLVIEGKAVGLLGLANKPGGFTEADADTAAAFGELASVALMNSRRLELLQQRTAEIERMNEVLEMRVLERTAGLEAISKELGMNYEGLGVINNVLRIAHEPIPLDVILGKVLDLILSVSWLTILPKGCVFLVDHVCDVLTMKVSRGLDEPQILACTTVPFGKCICGRAASLGEIQYVNRIDERHEIMPEGISPHGHYCVPISTSGAAIGVICLYTEEYHPRNSLDERLLLAIADTLAGVIERNWAETRVAESEKRYRRMISTVSDYIYTVEIADGVPVKTAHGPGCLSVTGYASDEFRADPYLWYRMIHDEDRNTVTEYASQALSGTQISPFEHRIIHKNGSIRWVRNTPVLRFDEQGRLIAYDSMISDITTRKTAEESVRRSEKSLANAQRVANLGNWEWDIRNNTLVWSEETYRIFGFEPRQFVATYEAFLDSVHPEDREFVRKSVDLALINNTPYSIDHRIVLPDGTQRVVHEQAEVVFDKAGAPLGMSGTVQDITERNQAEMSIRVKSDLLAAISHAQSQFIAGNEPRIFYERLLDDFLSLTNSEYGFIGEVVYPVERAPFLRTYAISNIAWNDETRKYYEKEAPLGLELRKLESLWGAVVTTGKPVIANSPSTDPRRGGLPEGHPQLHAFMGLPLYSGKILSGMVGVANRPRGYDAALVEYLQPFICMCENIIAAYHNNNDRIKAEEQLKEYASNLEEKVCERTVELERSKALAEAATRAKSEFLANMSHELRTPLNAVLGFSEILRDGLAGEVNPQQKEYLNDIWESGSHLLRLINDILDISKIEAGKMELEPGDVRFQSLLDNALVLFREKALRHNIRLVTKGEEDLPPFLADGRKIMQVLINMLTNALKFTPDGGEVGVEAAIEADEIHITVWDTGIGIAPEDLGRLFQPFQQLESALTKKHQGTGLGLHLCRKIVELHGGRIWAESTPGQGSRFTFTIPFAPRAGDRS